MNHEISFNKTWLWIQFNVYEMNILAMWMCVKDIQDGNRFDLPFNEVDDEKVYFKYNDQSRRRKGCILMQTGITQDQYKKLCESFPDRTNTYPWD